MHGKLKNRFERWAATDSQHFIFQYNFEFYVDFFIYLLEKRYLIKDVWDDAVTKNSELLV